MPPQVGGAYAHARPELMAAAREGAAVCLLVFSCTDRAGFLQLSNRLAALGTLPVLLVATKADLASTCSVTMVSPWQSSWLLGRAATEQVVCQGLALFKACCSLPCLDKCRPS